MESNFVFKDDNQYYIMMHNIMKNSCLSFDFEIDRSIAKQFR
jgi:hypothetical protein